MSTKSTRQDKMISKNEALTKDMYKMKTEKENLVKAIDQLEEKISDAKKMSDNGEGTSRGEGTGR